jgi:hypothetical protein
MQELAEIGARHTGFPVIPVVKYHRQYQRDINLRGHFHNFGYHHLGLFVFEIELGTLLNSAGIRTEDVLGVKDEQEYEALNRRMMAWWDRQKKRDRIFVPWKTFMHPQLGRVEIGGLLRRHTACPTLDHLKKIVRGTYRFTVDHASRHPWVRIEELSVDRFGPDIARVRARVANRGQLPTHVSNKGRTLRRLPEVRVEFHLAKGVRLLSHEGHVQVGHLAGLTGSRTLEWFVMLRHDTKTLGELAVWAGTGGNVRTPVTVEHRSSRDAR